MAALAVRLNHAAPSSSPLPLCDSLQLGRARGGVRLRLRGVVGLRCATDACLPRAAGPREAAVESCIETVRFRLQQAEEAVEQPLQTLWKCWQSYLFCLTA
jgi:hypothetical protein